MDDDLDLGLEVPEPGRLADDETLQTVRLRLLTLARQAQARRHPGPGRAKVCRYCRSTFGASRSDARYCSSAHKQADYRRRHRASARAANRE